jgi:hypothetical protein
MVIVGKQVIWKGKLPVGFGWGKENWEAVLNKHTLSAGEVSERHVAPARGVGLLGVHTKLVEEKDNKDPQHLYP